MGLDIRKVLMDVLFYIILPISIWRYGRFYLSEYLAMFISALSTISYTIYKFRRDKQYNFTGIFVVSFIIINLLLNILANSALQILYNGLYLNVARLIIFIISIIISKPLARTFYLDYRTMYGEDKDESKKYINNNRKLKLGFIISTILLSVRELLSIFIRYYYINQLGVLGTEKILFYTRITTYLFSGIIGIMVFKMDKIYNSLIDINETGE